MKHDRGEVHLLTREHLKKLDLEQRTNQPISLLLGMLCWTIRQCCFLSDILKHTTNAKQIQVKITITTQKGNKTKKDYSLILYKEIINPRAGSRLLSIYCLTFSLLS